MIERDTEIERSTEMPAELKAIFTAQIEHCSDVEELKALLVTLTGLPGAIELVDLAERHVVLLDRFFGSDAEVN